MIDERGAPKESPTEEPEERRSQSEELAPKSPLKSEFLSDMSHELRTPLNAILGFSELLLGETYGKLSEPQRERIVDISAAGRQLLSLVNDILDLSRIEAGRVELVLIPIDLRTPIEDALALTGPLAKAKNVEVKTEFHAPIFRAVGDSDRVRQIIVNFLSNAIKFSADGGAITIATRSEGGASARIEVSDEGAGISPSDAKKLFTPFSQLDGGKKAGGAGLGLSISRRLVELMSGRIGVESEVGKGATFFFTLPITTAGAMAGRTDRDGSAATAEAAITEPTKKERILVVDDSAVNRTVLRAMLEAAGFEVAEAERADEGIRMARELPPKLILMDIRMPDMNGLDATRALRDDPRTVGTPVIAVSAQAMTGDRELAFEAGCAAYVTKPVARKELLSAISSVLHSEGAE